VRRCLKAGLQGSRKTRTRHHWAHGTVGRKRSGFEDPALLVGIRQSGCMKAWLQVIVKRPPAMSECDADLRLRPRSVNAFAVQDQVPHKHRGLALAGSVCRNANGLRRLWSVRRKALSRLPLQVMLCCRHA